jgi:hypothetical protein
LAPCGACVRNITDQTQHRSNIRVIYQPRPAQYRRPLVYMFLLCTATCNIDGGTFLVVAGLKLTMPNSHAGPRRQFETGVSEKFLRRFQGSMANYAGN